MRLSMNKRYFKRTLLFALIGTPVIVSLMLVVSLWIMAVVANVSEFTSYVVAAAIIFAALILPWIKYVSRTELPESLFERFLPIVISFSYYITIWVLVMAISHYRYSDPLFASLFLVLTAPYIVPNFFFLIATDFTLFPFIQIAVYSIVSIIVAITGIRCNKPASGKRMALILAAVFVVLCSVASYQCIDRKNYVLPSDGVSRIEEEVNLYYYQPFSEKNNLRLLCEEPALTIESNYPKLDGATAAYPVYAAMAQGIYRGLDERTAKEFVECNTTSKAYERLISGEADVFFGAQPSKQQMELAASKGVELKLIPIAKEAFVFFVNRENLITGLTVEQIQDIYQKKITNWKDFGGADERIMPFQRPENSGSQTIMLAKVMNGKSLPEPLWEEYSSFMGSMISDVAQYRNYMSAIGYSFRYYATGMNPNNNIRLLSVNGIEPNVENIRSGTYPFTVDVYAVTAGSKNENTKKLIEWILSGQGQAFIGQCGYVGIK